MHSGPAGSSRGSRPDVILEVGHRDVGDRAGLRRLPARRVVDDAVEPAGAPWISWRWWRPDGCSSPTSHTTEQPSTAGRGHLGRDAAHLASRRAAFRDLPTHVCARAARCRAPLPPTHR